MAVGQIAELESKQLQRFDCEQLEPFSASLFIILSFKQDNLKDNEHSIC